MKPGANSPHHGSGTPVVKPRGHAITIYVPDHATKDQVEHIQQTLQMAVDKLPDRAFIIVDLPKGLSADLAIQLKHEMQQIADEVSREFPGA